MEPQIQYAKTSDGVNIAYGTVGSGPAVVVPHAIFEQFSLAWQMPEWRHFLEQLGEGRMLVMYDSRGFGLSERGIDDLSLEARLLDMEAVVRTLKLRRFALFAFMFAGPTAIAYAARHPRLVTHLILYGTHSRLADGFSAKQAQAGEALVALCRSDWQLASQLLADSTTREQHSEAALSIAEHWRQAVSGETAAKLLIEGARVGADDLLAQIRVPTLVLHRRGDPTFASGQRLAAGIPKARFAPLEGTVNAYWLGDSESILNAVREFLEEGPQRRPSRTEHLGISPVTILFTDVEGSTPLTQRLGDAKARELLREHERMVREALKAHGGSEVKTMGDGFMASFSSATKALECAIAIQRAFAERNETAEEPIKVRIGLNAGEPIVEDDPDGRGDLFGTAVNLAARIAAKAGGGEILASNVVRELVAGKEFLFNDRGETELRGFEDPVRVYEVRWRE
ncbi:MAG: adenylate/guanylate cyclase domain-containing protein [Chloroflexi bacterium]|nr:adenylate/guanylate cyclase domain-containing protein [Chloroflexota bacterium]